jgi:hypothetical protein
MLLKAVPGNEQCASESVSIDDPSRLEHFYGRDSPPRVRYVRERARVDYGKAHQDEYELELMEPS